MTVLCGGGASGPKASSPAASYLIGNSLENVVQAALGVSEVWASILVFCAAQSIPWNTFCATDPPAMPTFTVQDIEVITTEPWNLGNPAFGKLVDLVEIGAWYFGCQCNTVITPAAPAYPSYPSGAPDRVLPPGSYSSGTCLNVQATAQWTNVTGGGFQNVTPDWLGAPATTVGAASGGFPSTTVYGIPTGATQQRYLVNASNPSAPSNIGGLYLVEYNSAGSVLQFVDLVAPTVNGVQHQAALNASTAYIAFLADLNQSLNGSVTTWSMTYQFLCAASNSQQAACCPPDASLLGQLQLIFNMVQGIYESLPTAVNSLAESTVHSNLSGSSQAAVGAETIAIKVEITTDIAGAPTSPGTPTYYFNRGYIVPQNSEGPVEVARRLVYSPQIYFLPHLTNSVGYTLPPGLVVSITELVPGP